jgi:hypothetical protein|tara:strand:- start:191 stop:961 length:771 start_codon:yes stop_codon:yes gene_type:complete
MQENKGSKDPWSRFQAELDAWAETSLKATLWWRDDDAVDDTPPLRTLLTLSSETPIALAVIPEPALEGLASCVGHRSDISILQHGFSHSNYAPANEKKSEYGRHRPDKEILNEINRGYTRLQELFIQSVQPIFVPPWNRIDDHLIPLVSELGFCAVSAFGREKPGIELQQINTHIDLIDWRGTRGFVGEDVALIALSNQLSERRHNKNCSKKAIGLMTHHLNHDKETWRFIERLLEVTLHNSACKWMPVETLLEQT